MIIFWICLALAGIYFFYKGSRPLVKLSGLIEEKRLINFTYTSVKFKGPTYSTPGTYLELQVRVDQVDEPYGPEFMGQTVPLILMIPKEEMDLINEGDRMEMTLKRFVYPGGLKRDSLYRTIDGSANPLADRIIRGYK